MAIPAGHIITVGGLNVVDRLQDTGLQNPKVPTETVRETGNDLVVGKILTEADFAFQMQSWDVSCDMMALLNGKMGGTGATEGPASTDAVGTLYHWENCQFVNLACPWARDTGTEGGDITSGVLVPAYYPSALTYKFGVTANAEQTVTVNGGAYYMSDAFPIEAIAASAFPIEEFVKPIAKASTMETKEPAKVYRIGGFGSEKYRHVFGVLVNGVIQQEGIDYVEEGGAIPGKAATKVKIKFTKEFAGTETVKFMYFSTTAHAIPQAAHASTVTTPAAVRGRNIEIIVAPTVKELDEAGKFTVLHGIQAFDLSATHTGTIQREMGYQDPIGYNETGIDTNGTITMDPKEEASLYSALATMTGISREEVFGYINEHAMAMKAVIYNPAKPSEILKSIIVPDAKFQIPGTAAKVNTTLSLPLTWESELGTFYERKGE